MQFKISEKDHEKRPHRHHPRQTAHLGHIRRARGSADGAGHQEQAGLVDGVVEHVQQRPGDGDAGDDPCGGPAGRQQPGAGANADGHVAHLADGVKGQGSAQVALHDGHQPRPQECDAPDDQQHDSHRRARGEHSEHQHEQQVDPQ